MTAPRTAGVPATLTVEYDCGRCCVAEFDLEDVHIRFTLGQMLVATEAAHDRAHDETQSVYRDTNGVLVRASFPAAAR